MIPGKIFGNKEMRLLMLGLDAAGKTSECITRYLPQILFCAEGGHHEAILYKLKLNQSVTTIPTGLYL